MSMRSTTSEPILPQFYVPFRSIDKEGQLGKRGAGILLVRTSGLNPRALAAVLRQEVPRARPEFRVSRIRTQMEINLFQRDQSFFAERRQHLREQPVQLFLLLHAKIRQRVI